ncbi:hypothetical protein BGX21_006054 [Mortierella sp. AD011]|nr:hypothetical protein BGX20_006349 [Mortierella sp. AD010]KAF9403983.1 hypothetical protein BGX21_006054 [Mortierella sp. AD011]
MASFPRAKVDSSTQTDPPLPFTAFLDRALDRVEATVPLNLSSITFYIRRHHLSRIEQIEALLSRNFFFKFILYRIGLKPQHVFSFLFLLALYGCRQLYRRSVYLTTNLCAVAYPAYCSIRTINSEPIKPPRGLGLEPTEYSPVYGLRRSSSFYSSSGSIHSNRQRARKRHSRMSNSMLEDSMQSSNSYSSSQEDYESRRSEASSWGRPSEYNYSEDNFTTTSGSISMTVEEKMKQRMRRKWAQFSQTRKDKATRQWLAYWSIYGTVQVVDTWSSFLLDWIPGYNLGKLLFLWWAQRRGATLVFDYFQPLIQSKNKDGREVARKSSNRSLNSEMSHQHGGSSGGADGSGSGRPRSIQMLPSTLAHQQLQQQQQFQQHQFEQQFYTKGSSSRRDTAAFRDLNQNRHRRDDYYDDGEEEDDDEEYHSHNQQRQYILQQQLLQQHQKHQDQPLDLRRELMASSPHDSGSFAEAPLFESAESVWSAPPGSSSVLAVDSEGMGARSHSNNATPTPMSVQEQYNQRQQLHQSTQKQQTLTPDANSYAVASTMHWNPATSSATSTEEL